MNCPPFDGATVVAIHFSTGNAGDWASAKDAISFTGHLRRETMAFGIAIHALAAVIWVGGMFFAYMVLRPSAGPLEAPVRLKLWERVFSRFFPWVWTSVAALLASGLGMIFWGYGGFAAAGTYVHVMLGIGLLMMAIYAHLYFVPWRRLSRAVAAENWAEAGMQLAVIRRIVAVNLTLGLITVAIGASGRFWG
jgi:uncharacterized membrane protein